MKKTFCLVVLLLLSVTGAWAQKSVTTKEVHGVRFVVPTIDLLVRYMEQDFKAWEAEMSTLGFTCISEDKEAPVYQQGKLGEMLLCISKSRLGLVAFSWLNFVDKVSPANDLLALLKPYASGRDCQFQYYAYGDWIIGVEKTDTGLMYREQILIRHK